jgi:Cyclic GMP-AMP synthase DncV-like, nucleotidyltransferase domain
MSDKTTRRIIEEIAASIDIPESAYEKAEARYKDLGEWFGRPEAKCADFDPHIRAQGSFRLGTVVRSDEYDLDFGCRLRRGISKSTHTQKQLKALVGADMEEYRRARRIEGALQERPRCWRLPYADEMSFHMDGVPSIPEEARQRQLLAEAMARAGSTNVLAQNVASFAGSITDNRLPNYEQISPNWRISNSEGYALWFESRMKLAIALLENRALEAKAAQVDELPARIWKSPLQHSVQALKCHRNVMFADDPDGKPISVIITTLAAAAYQGEQDVASALDNILTNMGNFVCKTRPRVPNPVNPPEDFADKWYDPKYAHLNLERKFWLWLEQAQNDFQVIGQSRDASFIAEQVQAKLATALDVRSLRDKLGLGAVNIITAPKSHTIVQTPAKPWMRE